MVFFIFVVAVLNLGLGFALAVFHARILPHSTAVAAEVSVEEAAFFDETSDFDFFADPPPAAEQEGPPREAPSQPDTGPEDVVEEVPQQDGDTLRGDPDLDEAPEPAEAEPERPAADEASVANSADVPLPTPGEQPQTSRPAAPDDEELSVEPDAQESYCQMFNEMAELLNEFPDVPGMSEDTSDPPDGVPETPESASAVEPFDAQPPVASGQPEKAPT